MSSAQAWRERTVHPERDRDLMADVAFIVNQAGCDTSPGIAAKRWSLIRPQAVTVLETLAAAGRIKHLRTIRDCGFYGPASGTGGHNLQPNSRQVLDPDAPTRREREKK